MFQIYHTGNNARRNHPWGDCGGKMGVILGVIFDCSSKYGNRINKNSLLNTGTLIAGGFI